MRISINVITCLLISIASLAQSNTAMYYQDKAEEYIRKKDYKGAMKTLTLAINEMPDSISLYDMRGALFEAFSNYEAAIKDFTSAIEKSEDNTLTSHLLANRGGTKYRIRDFEGSYSDLILAVQLDSMNIDALNNLAAVCKEINRPEDALKYLNQIILIDSTYSPAYVNLGFTYQEMQQHEKAIVFFDKAVELAPEEALGYSNRSFSKLKKNDLKGAMNDINQSIKLMPSNSYAYKIRALIEIEKGKLVNACKDLTRSIELGYTQQYGEEVNELKSKYCNKSH